MNPPLRLDYLPNDRRTKLLRIMCEQETPLTVKEFTEAMGEVGWQRDETNRTALAFLVTSEMAVKRGNYRKTYEVTNAGRAALGFPASAHAPDPSRQSEAPVGRLGAASDDLFDPGRFAVVLRSEIRRRGVSDAQVAREIGITAAGLSMILQGRSPSVETFLRLLRWGGVSRYAVNAFSCSDANE